MNKKKISDSSYICFSRNQWSSFKNYIPKFISVNEIKFLKKINKFLSLKEVIDIYLPLLQLLNIYINSNIINASIIEKFFRKKRKVPYIISITGSVSVGKSTTAKIIQAILKKRSKLNKVELITTDCFLYPNKVLKKRNLMEKKGFPQSYDIHQLIKFILDIKSGVNKTIIPIYSHYIYDIDPTKKKIVYKPDILILEGLNLLQKNSNMKNFFISDFVDFSIYLHASETLLKKWFISRFFKFRNKAKKNPDSYFYYYSQMSKAKAKAIAIKLWKNINFINLKKNILPTKEHANLVMIKSSGHAVKYIKIRK